MRTMLFERMTCLAVAAAGLTWAAASGGETSIKIGVMATLSDPAVQECFTAIKQNVWSADEQTPEGLAAKEQAEVARLSPIVKEPGVEAE